MYLIKNAKKIFDIATALNCDLGKAKSIFIHNCEEFKEKVLGERQADSDAFDKFINVNGKYKALTEAYASGDMEAFQAIVDEAIANE